MKKVLKIISTMLLSAIMVAGDVVAMQTKSNALKPLAWSEQIHQSNYDYSFGQKLDEYWPSHPMRGKMWIYSGDTFGYEYSGNIVNYDNKYSYKQKYKIKFKMQIVKGVGKIKNSAKLTTGNDLEMNTTKLTYTKNIRWGSQYYYFTDGRTKVTTNKGCTVKMTFSFKESAKKKWINKSFKVKVKKLPVNT